MQIRLFCQKSEAFSIAGPLMPLCVKSKSPLNLQQEQGQKCEGCK
ncbi:hypothetical protein ATCC51561_132 [Campylobacter concisus ATCC 51561]|nr:hypothetical protein ATCC51561_132 [Campylobacter concisus ATCC 51561]